MCNKAMISLVLWTLDGAGKMARRATRHMRVLFLWFLEGISGMDSDYLPLIINDADLAESFSAGKDTTQCGQEEWWWLGSGSGPAGGRLISARMLHLVPSGKGPAICPRLLLWAGMKCPWQHI